MFNIVQHPADNSGCGHYRMKFPAWSAQTLRRDIRIIESMKLIPIKEFYQDVRMVRIQRQISTEQCNYVLKFLKPLSQRYGFWLTYEIDDVIHMKDIPKYNSGWETYQNPQLMENIKQIVKVCDILTVTTEELGNYFVKNFGVHKENIFVVPNHLPRWWIGDSYNLDRITYRFENNVQQKGTKPRVGILSSVTHYDIHNRCDGKDDMYHLNDFVRSTVDKYQWVFAGGISNQLKDLVADGKIEHHIGFDLLNYPRRINDLSLDLVVAPLLNNVFNRCKSNIKFLEMSALGIPVLCQDLSPYRKYTDLRFKDANELQNLIDNLLGDKSKYLDVVKGNRNIIDHGDENAPKGWWLENNMDRWFKLFCINQKTLMFDLSKVNTDNQGAPQAPKPITFEV
jgi:hypothetical protein